MPDISELNIGGTVYTVKDYVARQADGVLSKTSERAIQNRVVAAVLEELGASLQLNNNVLSLVNRNGTAIGNSVAFGVHTYTPQLTDLLGSRVINVASGTQVELEYSYSSVDNNQADDGPGIGKVMVNGTSTSSFNVAQGSNTHDVTSMLTDGENTVVISVTNSEGITTTLRYSVIILTQTMTTNFTTPSAYYGAVNFTYILTGAGTKTVHYVMDNVELDTDTVVTSGGSHSFVIPSQTPGVHTFKAYSSITADNVTVTSNVIELQMIWGKAAIPEITLQTGQYAIRYFDTDGTYLYGYAATAGTDAINPVSSGLISAPTKEGTSDTSYAYSGWSSLPTNIAQDYALVAAYTTSYKVRFVNNGITFDTQWVSSGENASAPSSNPTKSETSSKVYVFSGWTATENGTTADADALSTVTAPRTLYAVYQELSKFTVRFMNGSTVLQTVTVVQGNNATYTGAEPTSSQDGYIFSGWLPSNTNIQADTDCVAQFKDGNTPLSKYLGRTMTAYESTGGTTVAQYSFYQQTNLQTVETNTLTVQEQAFGGCTALTTVDLTSTSAVTIQANAFANASSLAHLIVRSTTVSTLSAASALTGTKIASGVGAIYVPADLVAAYKAASNWSTYAAQIFPITEYPKTDFSTISDTWAEIIANSDYATDYVIGDTKMLDLGAKGQIYMELVALDTDDKADNSGKARMTWISKPIIETHAMNATSKTSGSDSGYTAGGWENTDMRAYLKDTIKPLIPEAVRNAIVNVTKVSSIYTGGALVKDGQTTTDDVWIPSVHEIFNNTNYETTGPVYSSKFNSNANRIKKNAAGSADSWWLRSASGANNFGCVNNNGSESGSNASGAYGLVLGFCI